MDEDDEDQEDVEAVSPPDAAALLSLGEESIDALQFGHAARYLQQAWAALPDPKDDQPLAVQILAAISDCEFNLGNWGECHSAMQHALRCGLPLDNVFARLRLGQSLYELGNEQEAANWLVPVYLMHGRGPFGADDPKYLEFFRSKLHPPEGGWPKGW